MASAFDPYLQWLGIRDPQRPPNHYRLLGLELFENDASVISMSADRQMAHLRNFKTGPEAEVAERLLNELSAARICLLKAERKLAYDDQLRAALKPNSVSKSSPAAAPSLIAAAPSAMPAVTAALRPSGTSVRTAIPVAKAAWRLWAILAGLMVLCAGLTALLIMKNSPPGNEKVAVAEDGGKLKTPAPKNQPKPQPPLKKVEITPVTINSPSNSKSINSESSKSKTVSPKKTSSVEQQNNPIAKSLPENSSGSNNNNPPKEQPISTNTNSPNSDRVPILGEEIDLQALGKATGSETSTEEPANKSDPTLIANNPAVEAAKPKRLAIPDKATLTAKEKEVREVFTDEYKSQKPELKAALAAKLRQSSTESKEDSTMRYVLLNEARANAMLAGIVKLAVEITDELVRDYDVIDAEERFTLFSKLLAGANRNPAYSQLVIEELRKTIEKLQESDDYDVALKLVNMAQAAARNMRDPALITEMTQRAKELNLQKTSFQRAKAAKENLAKSPNDPAANEVWGSYLSFTKGQFEAGLPFLARGSSAELADLAARELANKQAQAEQLELADDWWAYGEKIQSQDSIRSLNIRQHAGQKYVALLPKLTGIDKAKAEKRIGELKKLSEQKNLRDQEQLIRLLLRTPWLIKWENHNAPPERMVFKQDGTLEHLTFHLWAFENNELVLKGVPKDNTFLSIGKVKFISNKFEVDFYQGGVLSFHGTALPSE